MHVRIFAWECEWDWGGVGGVEEKDRGETRECERPLAPSHELGPSVSLTAPTPSLLHWQQTHKQYTHARHKRPPPLAGAAAPRVRTCSANSH